jgi:hypothetical protein
MANISRPKGFRPQERALRESAYIAAATIYPGDLVKMDATGQIVVGTAGAAAIGVAVNYAASGDEVMVWDHPEQKFVVQADAGTTLAQTNIGLNYDVVATAGDATYKQSRMELDSSTGATLATLPLRLLGISRQVGTEMGEFAKCVVQINAHQLGPNSAGL